MEEPEMSEHVTYSTPNTLCLKALLLYRNCPSTLHPGPGTYLLIPSRAIALSRERTASPSTASLATTSGLPISTQE
jgi:hypothetical protein